jgi:hypothetical protein
MSTKDKLIFKVGDKVKHVLFGNGKVIAIKENSFWPYVIRFDKSGNEENYSDYSLTLIK